MTDTHPCRRCGKQFPPLLLTEFQGIEVWEKRYCVSCTEARVREENEWASTRTPARAAVPFGTPTEGFTG